jgi:hypothetical protein
MPWFSMNLKIKKFRKQAECLLMDKSDSSKTGFRQAELVV